MPAKSHLEAYVSKQDFPNFDIFGVGFLADPWLAWLTSPRIGLARLACTNNSNGGLLLRGAGKASEADPRRGKPSKPRPGEKADPKMPKFGKSCFDT